MTRSPNQSACQLGNRKETSQTAPHADRNRLAKNPVAGQFGRVQQDWTRRGETGPNSPGMWRQHQTANIDAKPSAYPPSRVARSRKLAEIMASASYRWTPLRGSSHGLHGRPDKTIVRTRIT